MIPRNLETVLLIHFITANVLAHILSFGGLTLISITLTGNQLEIQHSDINNSSVNLWPLKLLLRCKRGSPKKMSFPF